MSAKEYEMSEICAVCSQRWGLHSASRPSRCPGEGKWKAAFFTSKSHGCCPDPKTLESGGNAEEVTPSIEAVKARCSESAGEFQDETGIYASRALLIAIDRIKKEECFCACRAANGLGPCARCVALASIAGCFS